MLVNEIKLFELLKAKIGEKEAEAFVEILETRVDSKFEEKTQIFKEDTKSLKEYMDKVFATKEDLANLKTEITKTVYTVGLVQYIAMLASLIAIIKFLM